MTLYVDILRSLYSVYALFESETCSAWLASPNKRETHLTLEKLVRGRILLIKETSITTIRSKMKRIQKDLTTSLLHSRVTRASETQHNSAHARQVTSHNSVHSDTDNISYPY